MTSENVGIQRDTIAVLQQLLAEQQKCLSMEKERLKSIKKAAVMSQSYFQII